MKTISTLDRTVLYCKYTVHAVYSILSIVQMTALPENLIDDANA